MNHERTRDRLRKLETKASGNAVIIYRFPRGMPDPLPERYECEVVARDDETIDQTLTRYGMSRQTHPIIVSLGV